MNVSRKRIAPGENLAAVRALALHNKGTGAVVGLPLAGGAISRVPVGEMETLQGV